MLLSVEDCLLSMIKDGQTISTFTFSPLLTLVKKCLDVPLIQAAVTVALTVYLVKKENVLEETNKTTCWRHTRSNHLMESTFSLIAGL